MRVSSVRQGWGDGGSPEMPFHLQTFQSALQTFHSFGFLLINKQFETPKRKLNPLVLSIGTRTLFPSSLLGSCDQRPASFCS